MSDKIKNIVSEILDIPVSNHWDIYDSIIEDGLYLVHFNPNSDMKKYNNIRGLIVDIDNRIIICASGGYTPSITLDQIEYDDNNKLVLTDSHNTIHNLKSEEIKFQIGLEGVVLRIFKYNNKVYYSTHKKIEVRGTKSRWGNSTTFSDMIEKLKFPSDDELFPSDVKNSKYVHIFMISHPDILHVSKDYIKNGYISYLGHREMNLKLDNNKDILKNIENITDSLDDAKNNNKYYNPKYLTIDEANKYLKYGYYPDLALNDDKRLRYGEFIMIYDNNGNWSIKLESEAYSWRSSMRNENPNIYHQYFILSGSSKTDTNQYDALIEYKRKYPIFDVYNIDSIITYLKSGKTFLKWNQNNTSNELVFTPSGRLYNIWICYIMSCPLHRQYEVSKIYNRYFEDKNTLLIFLYNLYITDKYEEINNNMITTLIDIAINKVSNSINISGIKLVSRDNFNKMVKNSIENAISLRHGPIIYKLIQSMTKYS